MKTYTCRNLHTHIQRERMLKWGNGVILQQASNTITPYLLGKTMSLLLGKTIQ